MNASEEPGRAAAAGRPLRLWQRLDWRFLLPDAPEGQVLFAGDDEELRDALVLHEGAHEVGADVTWDEVRGTASIVVLANPGIADLASAASAGRAGGWVYAEVRRGRGGVRSLAAWRRLFRQAGLVDVRAHWHVRDIEDGTRILPLRSTAAVRRLLAAHEGSRRGRVRAGVGDVVLRLGLTSLLAPEGSIAGRVPGSEFPAPAGGMMERIVAAATSDDSVTAADAFEAVLLTPREPTSRSVVAFVHRRADPRPLAVVKAPRRANDRAGLEQEAAGLLALAPSAGARVPRLLGRPVVGGHVAIVQTVVSGRALSPGTVRRDPAAALALGLAFIEGLPVTRAADQNSGWYERSIADPLARLVRVAPLAGETEDLARRTHQVLAGLRAIEIPAVLEHADLAYPNLLIGAPHDPLGVIDWERSSSDGMPGHDLVFFLQFLAEAERSADGVDAQVRAFESAFLQDQRFPLVLQAHLRARRLPPEIWPQVVVASWARTAAGLAGRLVPVGEDDVDGPEDVPADVGETVRVSREFALWRHVVEAAEHEGFGAMSGARSADR